MCTSGQIIETCKLPSCICTRSRNGPGLVELASLDAIFMLIFQELQHQRTHPHLTNLQYIVHYSCAVIKVFQRNPTKAS